MVEHRKDFWTFIVRGTKSEGSSAIVTGWFVVCKVESVVDPEMVSLVGTDQYFNFSYLTPYSEPVELDVSSLVPKGTRLDDISPRSITTALVNLFALPFQDIPRAPLTAPLHRVSPSQRPKVEAALRQQRTSTLDQPYGKQ